MSGVSDGIKAGGAIGGPEGAAIGGAIGAASDALQTALGGPFMGGASSAFAYGTTQDGSGWIVNIGGSQTGATASPVRTTTNGLPPTVDPSLSYAIPTSVGGVQMAGFGGVAGIALLIVCASLLMRRHK